MGRDAFSHLESRSAEQEGKTEQNRWLGMLSLCQAYFKSEKEREGGGSNQPAVFHAIQRNHRPNSVLPVGGRKKKRALTPDLPRQMRFSKLHNVLIFSLPLLAFTSSTNGDQECPEERGVIQRLHIQDLGIELETLIIPSFCCFSLNGSFRFLWIFFHA